MRGWIRNSLFVTVILVVLVLGISAYFYYFDPFGYSAYNSGVISGESVNVANQFYSNMRYKDFRISYGFEDVCNDSHKLDMMESFLVLQNRTLLKFYLSDNISNAEIKVFCSKIAPGLEEQGHFIAGEGGPSEIINESYYAVILSGRIALYREEMCNKPQVALHELLHVLGFNHNGLRSSILYPITDCSQKLNDEIVNEINRLYAVPSLPDLVLERAVAVKSGTFLNFNITIVNQGLMDVNDSMLEIYVNDTIIKSFDVGEIKLGTYILSSGDAIVPGDTRFITFVVTTDYKEGSKKNNGLILNIGK